MRGPWKINDNESCFQRLKFPVSNMSSRSEADPDPFLEHFSAPLSPIPNTNGDLYWKHLYPLPFILLFFPPSIVSFFLPSFAMPSLSSFVQMIVEPFYMFDKNIPIKVKVSDISNLILIREKKKIITTHKKG